MSRLSRISLTLLGIVLLAAPRAGSGQDRPAVAPSSLTSSAGFPHTAAFAAQPGPDAEYLRLEDRYTLEDNGAVVHERTSRLVLASYLAINRKYGETKIEYDSDRETVEVLLNRTVLPSGQTVTAPANAIVDDQPATAHGNPLWSSLRRKVIVHTALEPGAVVEETLRITRRPGSPPWLELGESLNADVPAREREISVTAPEAATLHWEVTGGSAAGPAVTHAGGQATWRWQLHDLPARPEEPGAPTKPEGWPTLWASTCPSRQALETELTSRLSAAGTPDGSLSVLARATADQTTSEEVRILKLLDAVASRMEVSTIPAPLLQAHVRPLAEVWRSGWATPLELAAVEQAALHEAGLSGSVALVACSGRTLAKVPAFAGAERPVLVVPRPGEGARFYDPQHPDQGGPLELALAGRDTLAATPLPDDRGPVRQSSRTLRLHIEVTADGAARGELELDATGAATPHARLILEADGLASELAGVLPGLTAKQLRVAALERGRASLTAAVEGHLPGEDRLGLVRLELGGVPSGVEPSLPPLPAADRHAPVAVPGPVIESVELTLTLPEGWVAAARPSPVKIERSVGSFEVSSAQEERTLKVSRRLRLQGPLVGPAEADELRALLVAWRSPSGRELILRPPAKR
jgi:hypothetical protein